MEFTELDELNDMIVFSKSYRPSLIPKFNKYFDFDLKAPQDLNFVSFDELLDNSFEDIPSPEVAKKSPQKLLSFQPERANETIEDILEDIGNTMANIDMNFSPLTSPKKIERQDDPSLLKPIEEETEHKIEESPVQKPKREEEVIKYDIVENGPYENEAVDNKEDRKADSLDEKKKILKQDNVSQSYMEKRKYTSSWWQENIKQNKGLVRGF